MSDLKSEKNPPKIPPNLPKRPIAVKPQASRKSKAAEETAKQGQDKPKPRPRASSKDPKKALNQAADDVAKNFTKHTQGSAQRGKS